MLKIIGVVTSKFPGLSRIFGFSAPKKTNILSASQLHSELFSKGMISKPELFGHVQWSIPDDLTWKILANLGCLKPQNGSKAFLLPAINEGSEVFREKKEALIKTLEDNISSDVKMVLGNSPLLLWSQIGHSDLYGMRIRQFREEIAILKGDDLEKSLNILQNKWQAWLKFIEDCMASNKSLVQSSMEEAHRNETAGFLSRLPEDLAARWREAG